jgi:drug/metabolite transporter (DMT)-like permease
VKNQKKVSHILNASATLLGLCFVVLTSLKVNKLSDESKIDELTSIAILVFLASCVLSYLSIRSKKEAGERFEKMADIVFLLGLFLLFTITMLISFNFI